jgi:hypothetical protein
LPSAGACGIFGDIAGGFLGAEMVHPRYRSGH